MNFVIFLLYYVFCIITFTQITNFDFKSQFSIEYYNLFSCYI